MKVQVLHVTPTQKGFGIAHVRFGNTFGDVLSTPDVVEPGEYELKTTVYAKNGRLVPMIRVEK